MKFHNLRDTCGVHMSVRRDPPQDIQWRLGHSDLATTEGYIGEARQAAGPTFGEPLAPIPDALLRALAGGNKKPPPDSSGGGSGGGKPSVRNETIMLVEAPGIEHGQNARIDAHSQTSDAAGFVDASESARNVVDAEPVWPTNWPRPGGGATGAHAVELALAHALTKAAEAGRFDVVAQLATELEERRRASQRKIAHADTNARPWRCR